MARSLHQQGLTGRQKAAILMISLGPEASANVFKHLKEDEIEQLAVEIASLRTISPATRDDVIQEFHELFVAQHYVSHGGIDYARDVLQRALGGQKAMELLGKLTNSLRPFDLVRRTDPGQLVTFIQNEHPQTIALIMAYLRPEQSAAILASLPHERQADVARRIAIMDRTSPEVLREVEQVLERKLSALVTQDYTAAGGVEAVVEVLNKVDRGTEKAIMESLAIQDPALAEEIKKRMFLFEDLVGLDNRAVQRVLREVDMTKDLPMALKVASEEVKRKVLSNVSRRAGEALKEAMDYLGPVRVRDVEEAQARVVNTIRRLEEEGEIVLSRGGGDDVVV